MEAKPALEGDDLKFFEEATNLKAQGVTQFTKKKPNKDKALELMNQAVDTLRKIQNRTSEVCVLEGQMCQNIALILK